MDKVTVVSDFLPNSHEDACGSDPIPVRIVPDNVQIKYGSSHCCHNDGFRLASFCSSSIPPFKKRAAPHVGSE